MMLKQLCMSLVERTSQYRYDPFSIQCILYILLIAPLERAWNQLFDGRVESKNWWWLSLSVGKLSMVI